jgi:hypothetical protein
MVIHKHASFWEENLDLEEEQSEEPIVKKEAHILTSEPVEQQPIQVHPMKKYKHEKNKGSVHMSLTDLKSLDVPYDNDIATEKKAEESSTERHPIATRASAPVASTPTNRAHSISVDPLELQRVLASSSLKLIHSMSSQKKNNNFHEQFKTLPENEHLISGKPC